MNTIIEKIVAALSSTANPDALVNVPDLKSTVEKQSATVRKLIDAASKARPGDEDNLYSSSDISARIDANDAVDAAQTSSNADIASRVTAAENAAITLMGRVAVTETKNAAQDGRLTDAETAATALAGRVTTAEGTLSAVNTQVTSNAPGTILNRMITAESSIGTLNTQVITGGAGTIRQRVVDVETKNSAQDTSIGTLNTQVITGGAGTVHQRLMDVETQVITGGTGTVLTRVAAIESKNTAQDTSIGTLNTQVLTGGAGTVLTRLATAESTVSTLNTQVIVGGAGTVRQRLVDVETQVFSSTPATTILYRIAQAEAKNTAQDTSIGTLNTQVIMGGTGTVLTRLATAESTVSTLNTQVIVGGSGTVRQRLVDVETQVFNSVTTTTVLYRIVQIESKNSAQDTSINNLNYQVTTTNTGTLLARMGAAESSISGLSTQVYSNVPSTILYRVVQIESKNSAQDTAIGTLNTHVLVGGSGTLLTRMGSAESSISGLNTQVFSTSPSTTVLARLNAVVSLASTLNTHVLVGGSGTLLTRMGSAESLIGSLNIQVFSSSPSTTILARVVQIESKNAAQDSSISTLNTHVLIGGSGTLLTRMGSVETKNTAQDTSITYLRPNDNIADVGFYQIPIILALGFSTARTRLSAQFYMQLMWTRELGAIRTSPVTQVCIALLVMSRFSLAAESLCSLLPVLLLDWSHNIKQCYSDFLDLHLPLFNPRMVCLQSRLRESHFFFLSGNILSPPSPPRVLPAMLRRPRTALDGTFTTRATCTRRAFLHPRPAARCRSTTIAALTLSTPHRSLSSSPAPDGPNRAVCFRAIVSTTIIRNLLLHVCKRSRHENYYEILVLLLLLLLLLLVIIAYYY
jgi:uncharacterized coiled-coil protein SlyX